MSISEISKLVTEALFDVPAAGTPDHVRDEDHGTHTGYSYGCRCKACFEFHASYNHAIKRGQRICQYCGKTYPRSTGGGTKFCSECVQNGAYSRNIRPRSTPARPADCSRCGEPYDTSKYRERYDMCPHCRNQPEFRVLSGALGAHRASLQVVLQVMAWPYCANEQCGAWLLERAHRKRSSSAASRYVYNFAVDHDHGCCPGERSCGKCIRGIVCRDCNAAMPHRLDATKARGIADYLTAHEHG